MPIKTTILVAVVLSSIMYWSLSNICRFNYSIDKKTKILNELAREAQIDFGSAKVYYFKELNCLPANTEFEFQRLMRNLSHVSILVMQHLTTDIRGIRVEELKK